MQKVIDFRFRPPTGNFLTLPMYKNKDRTERMAKPTGLKFAKSMLEESMDLLFEEMESIGSYIGCVSGYVRASGSAQGLIENREVHDLVKKYPDRFIGIGGIDVSDREVALAEVDKCINDYGFKAILIEPANHKEPMYADDRRIYPLYGKCADLEIPVILVVGGVGGPDLTYKDPVHIEHVAADLPDLKIAVLHGGWPYVTQMLYVAFRSPNLYLSADNYIAFPGWEQYITAINTYMGDRFLYGSGYPFHPIVEYLQKFKSLGIKKDFLDNVLFKNAEKLLNLG